MCVGSTTHLGKGAAARPRCIPHAVPHSGIKPSRVIQTPGRLIPTGAAHLPDHGHPLDVESGAGDACSPATIDHRNRTLDPELALELRPPPTPNLAR